MISQKFQNFSAFRIAESYCSPTSAISSRKLSLFPDLARIFTVVTKTSNLEVGLAKQLMDKLVKNKINSIDSHINR